MTMLQLDRPVLIHCCKDKTLSYRIPGQPIFNGVALPVFSVNSQEEAEQLLIAVGRVQYEEHPQMPGQPWYKVTLDGPADLKAELDMEDLEAVSAKLAEAYKRLTGKRRIPLDLVTKYAKRLFLMEHPRSNWLSHPNYKQLRQQEYYIQCAAVLINNMLDDPEMRDLFGVKQKEEVSEQGTL